MTLSIAISVRRTGCGSKLSGLLTVVERRDPVSAFVASNATSSASADQLIVAGNVGTDPSVSIKSVHVAILLAGCCKRVDALALEGCAGYAEASQDGRQRLQCLEGNE